MTAACIETYSGNWFDILNPQSEQLNIVDIAHSLSLLCRFTGHVKHFYSVGQHSLLGSYIISEDNALEFLLHDAAEAFLGDMNRPLKHLTAAGPAYQKIEENIMRVIRLKFGLPMIQSECIYRVDNQMLYAEKEQLMTSLPWTKESKEGCQVTDIMPATIKISEFLPLFIENAFLNRFNQLRRIK